MSEQRYWNELIEDVVTGRIEKPRTLGLTMVIDTGFPLTLMRNLLELAGNHIDFWKFGFASASVSSPAQIVEKVTLCEENRVYAYPGGTSLEIAYTQGVWRQYIQALWNSGIRAVEISDGTICLPPNERQKMIYEAKKIGFIVLTEVGKKVKDAALPIAEQAKMIHKDVKNGADYVIVEGRESGTNVGVYDENGTVRQEDVIALMELVGDYGTRLIWEAPLVKQQTFYLQMFGNQMNFGNVRPMDIVALESLRRGFRSDTFRTVLGPDSFQSRTALGSDTCSNEQQKNCIIVIDGKKDQEIKVTV